MSSSSSTDEKISLMEGETELPRSNGELIFEEPWESRAFGIALSLNDDRVYEWGEFRDQLVKEIARDREEGREPKYYDQWLASLEKLLLSKGLLSKKELDARTEEYASGQRDHEGHIH